ncbi:MAG: aminopeptidase, partial [Chryseobacterium sp.]
MKRFFCVLVSFSFNFWAIAQQDSIRLDVKLNDDQRSLSVKQTLIYHNPHQKSINQVKLLNWVAAYQKRKTPLLKRKIEDRKSDLYFAKDNQLGQLERLSYAHNNTTSEILNTNQENIFIPLSQDLKPGESITIDLDYQIKLPDARFTGYGINTNHILLKYFFLAPETFEDESQSNSFYRDTEETGNSGSFWRVNFEIPQYWKIYSNLNQINESEFQGVSTNDPEFQISKELYPEFSLDIAGQNVKVDLGYQTNEYQRQILGSVLTNQLSFIKERTG